MLGCGPAGDAPMAGAWARRYSDCMSTHGRPKCPRRGKHAAAAREAGIGAQAPLPVRTRPLGGKARSAKGAA
jgi:hypothetical protein